jgi:hypothetical protein
MVISNQANMREKYIIAQALFLAINKLEEVEGAMREVSNIEQMKSMMLVELPEFSGMFEVMEGKQTVMEV